MKLDILLCSGTSLMSRTIQLSQRLLGFKHWQLSHVAMLVFITEEMATRINLTLTQKELGYQIQSGLNVFESTTMNKWAGKKGVQINLYSLWLKNYKGRVWSRPVTARDSHVRGLTDCICEYAGVDYESGVMGFTELARCVLPDWLGTKPTLKLHCTEVDANTLQSMVLMEAHNPAKLPPAVWWEDEKVDDLMLMDIGKPEQLK
jgi:hypothetical protein